MMITMTIIMIILIILFFWSGDLGTSVDDQTAWKDVRGKVLGQCGIQMMVIWMRMIMMMVMVMVIVNFIIKDKVILKIKTL